MQIFLFFSVGILAGLMGGALGISGGVITVPCLIFLLQKEPVNPEHVMHLAIGTSLAAMVLTTIFSTIVHQRKKAVLWKIFYVMMPFIVGGCFLGAFTVDKSSTATLKFIFAFFTLSIGIYLLWKMKIRSSHLHLKRSMSAFLGFIVGFLSSLLGIGGGIVSVPMLTYWSIPEKNAVATSSATGIITSIAGSLLFYYFGKSDMQHPASFGYIYLPAFLPLAISVAFFAPCGAKLAHALSGRTLRKALGLVLILISFLTIFETSCV